jgi:hemoglobin
MTSSETVKARTPVDMVGGAPAVREIVDRFYDLMDSDPQYLELRALHENDLLPMRASLAGFLNAWLGGPRDWFEERPGRCVMSAHARIPVTKVTADQWSSAMRRAIEAAPLDPHFAQQMATALEGMACGMARA